MTRTRLLGHQERGRREKQRQIERSWVSEEGGKLGPLRWMDNRYTARAAKGDSRNTGGAEEGDSGNTAGATEAAVC